MAISRKSCESDRKCVVRFARLLAHLKNNDTFFNSLSLESIELLVSAEDKKEFFTALEKNNSVTSLSIYMNFVGSEFIQSLISSLQKNQTILKLFLEEERYLSKQQIDAIQDILNRNRKLTLDRIVIPKKVAFDFDALGSDEEIRSKRIAYAAFEAAESGDVDLLYTLVLERPDLLRERRYDFSGDTLLHIATEYGQVDCVKVLLKLGADVNFNHMKYDGRYEGTALHKAVGYNHIVIVQLLLNAGASVSSTANGFTPLHDVESLEIAKLLVERKADVNAVVGKTLTSCIGNSVLHSVPKNRVYSPGLLRFLIMNGADVNARNNQQYTPLHYLASGCSDKTEQAVFFECLNVLLRAGANPLLKEHRNLTFLDLAKLRKLKWIDKLELAVNDYIAFSTSIKALRQVGQYSDSLFTYLPDELHINIATFSTESNLLAEETKLGIVANAGKV